MKLHSFAILLAGLLFFSSSLEAQMRGGGYGDRGQRGERSDRVRIYDRLDLTSEQQNKLDGIRTAHRKQMIDKRAEIQKIRLTIQAEMRKDEPDMQAIEEKVKEQESLRTNMQLARVRHWNDVREVLTPEQREIWQQHRRGFGDFGERRGSSRRGHRGRW